MIGNLCEMTLEWVKIPTKSPEIPLKLFKGHLKLSKMVRNGCKITLNSKEADGQCSGKGLT
jgi:hypothetical protein